MPSRMTLAARAHGEPEHLHRDRVNDDTPVPIEARHRPEQVWVGEVPGEIIDADRDQVRGRAEPADEKVERRGTADDPDGERHRASVATRGHHGAECAGDAREL